MKCRGCGEEYIWETGNFLRKRVTVHNQQIRDLIYWLLCFEQVSNEHIHLLNKGSFGGRCISFPPFIIHRCIISGGKLIHRSLISGGKLISPPVDICCVFFFILDSIKGKYIM